MTATVVVPAWVVAVILSGIALGVAYYLTGLFLQAYDHWWVERELRKRNR